MDDYKLLHALKKFVLTKSDLNHVAPGYCKNISEYVFNETKNYISETTIKRFFGFASTQHKFSLFTLNSLSQYIGYQDWESFKREYTESDLSSTNAWEQLKIRAKAISNSSLTTKKNNSGIPFEYTAERTYFYPDFEYFLKNNYQFTTVSSPPGHGKSILFAHLAEHFFISQGAKYPNDILLLVNSSTIRSIIHSQLSIEDWLYQNLKFRNVGELFSYVRNNPLHCTGRFVLIIDGIDEFLTTSAYRKAFIDFLYSIEENCFFKVILGLRTNTWADIKPIIAASAFLNKSWFNGIFFDVENQSNVPALSVKEITFTLSKIEGKEITESDISDRLLNQLQIPLWLHIYYNIKNKRKILDLKNPIICYEMINDFLDQRVFLTRESTEKIFLLKKIASSKSKGKKGLRVAKEILLSDICNYQQAYDDLIFSGILIEEKRLTTIIPSEVIRFLNYKIYSYFLFIEIIEKFKYKITNEVLLYILKHFKDEPLSRVYILNWLIRFCTTKNEFEVLKNVFKLPFSNEEKKESLNFICHCILYEITEVNPIFKVDRSLIDIFISSTSRTPLYKKTIKALVTQDLDYDIKILAHVIDSNINITELDKLALNENINFLQKNYKRAGELFRVNPADLAVFFYNSLIDKRDEDEVLNMAISQLSMDLDKNHSHHEKKINELDVLNYRLVLLVLFTQKKYATCYHLALGILNKHPYLIFYRNSTFPMFILSTIGQVSLKLGYSDRALKIIIFLDKIITSGFALHSNCGNAYFYALKAVYYLHKKEYQKALENADAGILVAERDNFSVFKISLLLVKAAIIRQCNPNENLSNSLIDLIDLVSTQKSDLPEYVNINKDDSNEIFNVVRTYSKK